MKVLLLIILSLPAFAQKIISNVPNTQKKIALTFDACSTRRIPQYDKRITEILIKTRTPATIFLGGRWIEKEEPNVIDLAFNPLFELGNHSWDHPHLTQLTNEEIQDQLSKTQEALFKATGKIGRYFRPPYGEYDKRVLRIADSMGLTAINYDLASGDPDTNMTKEADKMGGGKNPTRVYNYHAHK